MSTGEKFGRPWRRRNVIGATAIVALVVVSLLTLGSAAGRLVAQPHAGDAAAAGTAMRSTHVLSRANGHASLVSRASGHAARHSLSSSSSSLSSPLSSTSSPASRLLAATGCGTSGSIADQTGFEDADGDLAPGAGCTDWNSFSPTWNGNMGTATLGGLTFIGLTDPTNSSSDSIYAGGVKQDTVCPDVTTGNVNDKADLGRIYVATETVNGDVYLFLAWQRQIDNTINSDVFVSFEFNQGKLACANSDGFVQRTKGDLLFDYNFQSGNSTIDANEWDGSTWQPIATPPFEAAVNSGTVTDTIGPSGSISLTKFEFGEAGINLSALDLAGNGGKACETFGSVLGGSRTSKSGDQAQLKDYVGPAPVDVSNCVKPTVTTALKNHADNSSIANGSSIPFGSTVHDTATLSNLVSGKTPTGKVQYTFFTNGNCSGAGTSAGLVTLNNDGSVPNSNPEGPLAAGNYSFDAQYLSGSDPNYSDSTVSSCEPFHVLAAPSITTLLSNLGPISIGGSVNDTATLHNATADAAGTAKYAFYSSLSACNAGTFAAPGGTSLGSKTVAAGVVPASDSTGPINAAGTYYFRVFYSGDANNSGPVSSACTDEALVVSPNTPSISTQLSADSISIGGTVHDSATLSNATSDAGGTVKYRYYGSLSDCNAGTFATPGGTSLGDKTVSGGVVPNSDAAGPATTAGTYYFRAFYSGDANNTGPVSSACTDEQLVVTPNTPSVSTQLSADSPVSIGTAVHDSATLNSATSDAGGTISYALFSDDKCQTQIDDLTPADNTVVNGVAPDSNAHTFNSAGTFYFQATYSGDNNNTGPVSSECTSEKLVVGLNQPSVSTQLSEDSPVSIGTSVHDSATLHGATADAGGTINYGLFSDNTCKTQIDDLTPEDNTVVNGVAPDSTAHTFNSAGTFYFQATYSGDNNNSGPVSSECTSETLVVSPNTPSVSTQLSESTGNVGDSVHDSATIIGATSDAGGTISYAVYSDNECSNLVADLTPEDNTVVNGVAPDSLSHTFNSAGTFYFQATYSGDNNNSGPVSSECTSEKLVINGADIKIVKTADAAQVSVGSSIGFTLTVYNDGNGDAHGVKLSDTLPTNPGLSWSIDKQGSGWSGSCSIDTASGVLSCGGANGVTVPANTTQNASSFTVHITSGTTGATGGDCPETGVVDNTGSVTTSNDGSGESSASTCVQAMVDLQITKSGSPASQTLGDGNITWTMVVTNNGPSADTGVKITDPMPTGNTFVSATTTKGTCTGGPILNCTIGDMAVGESVTITLITTPSAPGTQTNTVAVSGDRPETNTTNNHATASVEVGPFTPPKPCIAVSKVTPKQLFVGRKTTVTIHVTQGGKAVKGIHVRIKGARINVRTGASNSKGVVKHTLKMKKAGVLVFTPIASKRCNTQRVGVTNVFTPPVTG